MTDEQRGKVLVKLLNMFVKVSQVDEARHEFHSKFGRDKEGFVAALVLLANGMLRPAAEVVISPAGFSIEPIPGHSRSRIAASIKAEDLHSLLVCETAAICGYYGVEPGNWEDLTFGQMLDWLHGRPQGEVLELVVVANPQAKTLGGGGGDGRNPGRETVG